MFNFRVAEKKKRNFTLKYVAKKCYNNMLQVQKHVPNLFLNTLQDRNMLSKMSKFSFVSVVQHFPNAATS